MYCPSANQASLAMGIKYFSPDEATINLSEGISSLKQQPFYLYLLPKTIEIISDATHESGPPQPAVRSHRPSPNLFAGPIATTEINLSLEKR